MINLRLSIIAGITSVLSFGLQAQNNLSDYPIQQVKLNNVELTDHFWLPKIRTIQEKTIRYAFDKCDSEGRMENFITAGNVIRGGTGKVRGVMPFDDTDVYKTIEGAAYSLINAPNPALEMYIDSIINIIAYGQEPDGYLTTWRTIDPKNPPATWVKSGGGRWFDLGSSHELYNSGHLFEAAAAHYWATGKRNLLDIALKNADFLVEVFGDGEFNDVPGHQIIETGLIKLYRITENEDYLHLAKRFLDLRGDSIHRTIRGAYMQDHLPVVQQDEVVGHAVRAVYMYAGMTDIAALYGDSGYRKAIDKLWDNMISRKMYITGGLGARHDGEAFGDNYELPNLTAYSETCAAIGGIYWADRMFRLTGNSTYFDIAERMLYNNVIAGISLEGTEFFYPNALESDGKYKFNRGACTRQAWFDCSCCPTNLIRFIPFIPNLIYATQEDSLYINLFVANKADITLKNGNIHIEQETSYPWNGNVNISVSPNKPFEFTLKIRIPDWATNDFPSDLYNYTNKTTTVPSVEINDRKIDYQIDKGYILITKEWGKEETVSVRFPMEVRKIEANKQVKDDTGKFTVQCGPLVYCWEQPLVMSYFFLPPLFGNDFSINYQPNLLGGVNVLKYDKQNTPGAMLIPYYTWSNRGISTMKVFFDK